MINKKIAVGERPIDGNYLIILVIFSICLVLYVEYVCGVTNACWLCEARSCSWLQISIYLLTLKNILHFDYYFTLLIFKSFNQGSVLRQFLRSAKHMPSFMTKLTKLRLSIFHRGSSKKVIVFWIKWINLFLQC